MHSSRWLTENELNGIIECSLIHNIVRAFFLIKGPLHIYYGSQLFWVLWDSCVQTCVSLYLYVFMFSFDFILFVFIFLILFLRCLIVFLEDRERLWIWMERDSGRRTRRSQRRGNSNQNRLYEKRYLFSVKEKNVIFICINKEKTDIKEVKRFHI